MLLSPTNTLLLVSFLDMFGVGLIIPQLHNQARLLGCSHLHIGTMGAVYSASQLVSGPMIGNLSDLKGRKPTLLLTLALCGVAYLLLGLTSSILIFFTLRLFLGLVKQTQLLTKSIAPDYVKDTSQHSALFGKLATLSGLGMSVGPMTSGHLTEAFPDNGFMIITFLLAAMFAVNTYLISLLPDNNANDSGEQSNKSKKIENVAVAPKLFESVKRSLQESIDDLKKVDWTVYWDVFLYKLIITLCMGMYFSSFAVFLKTKHHVSPKTLGYMIAYQGGIGSLCTYFIDYINGFYKNDTGATKRNLHIFIAVTVSFLGMGLAPSLIFYIIFVTPLAVSGAVGRVSNLEMIMNKGHDEHRGSVIGAASSVRSLSGVVTPLLAGIISEFLGVTYVIFFAALFATSGVVISYRIRNNNLTIEKSKSD